MHQRFSPSLTLSLSLPLTPGMMRRGEIREYPFSHAIALSVQHSFRREPDTGTSPFGNENRNAWGKIEPGSSAFSSAQSSGDGHYGHFWLENFWRDSWNYLDLILFLSLPLPFPNEEENSCLARTCSCFTLLKPPSRECGPIEKYNWRQLIAHLG